MANNYANEVESLPFANINDKVSVAINCQTNSSYQPNTLTNVSHISSLQIEISSVIAEVVEEYTGLKLEFDANATTVAQFAYEVGVLNDIQVCEAIMANENITNA